jgi:hypothetical protein
MGPMTRAQMVTLTSAFVLMPRHGDCLSAFEARLIREVGQRWLDDRPHTLITDEEFRVIEDAVEAMRRRVRAAMPFETLAERLAELRAG